MAPERVTIKINARDGPDAPLEVHDAMLQILDFFDLLSSAGGSEGAAISWRLIHISMKSPLEATAEAIAKYPAIAAEPIAKREKLRLASSFESLTTGDSVPGWMSDRDKIKARSFFERNKNGIGRTDILFEENAPLTIVVERAANVALSTLSRADVPADLDRARLERGSIEGHISTLVTYYGKPALGIIERLSGDLVTCVLSDELSEKVGHQHDWSEAWSGRRVLVPGEISYRSDGTVSRVIARDIRFLDPPPIRYEKIADVNFTGGTSPAEYLEKLWENDIE